MATNKRFISLLLACGLGLPACSAAIPADRAKAEAAVSEFCTSKDPASAGAGLVSALDSEHWQVRQKAATCLGNLKYRDALPALVKLTKDPNPATEQEAFTALSAFGTVQAALALKDAAYTASDYTYRKKAAAAIGRMNNPDIVAIFIEEAKSSDTITADRAALVLVHMQNPAAVKPLMLAAQSENSFLRQAALDALASVSELDTAPEFAEVLKSTAYPQELRLTAAKSLALIRSSSSLAALDAFTADQNQPEQLRAETKKLYKSASMNIMRYLTAILLVVVAGGIWWMYRQGANL